MLNIKANTDNKFEDNESINYKRKIIFQTNYFQLIQCEWNKKSVSSIHHHQWSQCFAYVESGTFEDILHLGLKTETNIIQAGEVMLTPIGAKHEIKCLTETGSTLHLYLPSISAENLLDKNIFSIDSHDVSYHLKETPIKFNQLLLLIQEVQKNCVSTHSPYFMNQLFSGILPEIYIAENMLAQTKTTLATNEASPLLSKIETEIIDKLCELIQWPLAKRDGVTVPGGSSSNFMALHCARQKRWPKIKETGMGGEKVKMFVSEDAHYSFEKACVVLGFGLNNLVKIKTDSFGKMDTKELEKEIITCIEKNEIPFFVCATAGTTVYGSFDPILNIASLCQKYNVWLHVDAAWGGPVLFSNHKKYLMEGIHLADSITFDAHKLFGASLTSSFYLTRHKNLLLDANDVVGGDYLFHQNSNDIVDRGRLSWQCGRRADFFSFWTIWKSVGTSGLENFVDRLYQVRDEVLNWIECQPRIVLVKKPEYLNLCLRIKPPSSAVHENEWSQKVRKVLLEKNLAMVNYSKDKEGNFLRLILANPFLEFNHVKNILEWALEV